MSFYSKESKPLGFIVYSPYGLQSHVIMNNYGVVFSCNPMTYKYNEKALVFATKDEAELAKDNFYTHVSEVVLITKFECDRFVQD